MAKLKIYTWTTPNGRKATIAAEAMELDYDVIPVDLGRREQLDPAFRAISPNGRIPAIVDGDFSLMESGAILLYLAEKSGKLLPPAGSSEYWRTVEWLMWQTGGFGPMLGQAHHFLHFNRGASEYAERRYRNEAARLYRVLERRLTGRDYVADAFSVADIAIWAWTSRFEYQHVDLRDYPAVRDWYVRLAAMPAFDRGFRQPRDVGPIPMP